MKKRKSFSLALSPFIYDFHFFPFHLPSHSLCFPFRLPLSLPFKPNSPARLLTAGYTYESVWIKSYNVQLSAFLTFARMRIAYAAPFSAFQKGFDDIWANEDL